MSDQGTINKPLVTEEQVDSAIARQAETGIPYGEVLMLRGLVSPRDYFPRLAKKLGMPYLDLSHLRPPHDVLDVKDVESYATLLVVPCARREDGRVLVATSNPTPEVRAFVEQQFGEKVDLVIASKSDILSLLQRTLSSRLTHKALHQLEQGGGQFSARVPFTSGQLHFTLGIITLLMVGLYVAPVITLYAINTFVSLFFLCNFLLRALLMWLGASRDSKYQVTEAQVAALSDDELPVYTILVPMFKEPDVLSGLVTQLRRLDYPMAKLDIKLVLEESDHETIASAEALNLEPTFEIVRVPTSQPQTKPKACNYALNFARGEFVTIFDAEDQPEPDQLKKALVAFKIAGPRYACMQGRLNYYNVEENWLTRMFTLEYTTWFDFSLPGLERLGIPIPLGGTSNHFRTDILRELGAWDPYNVTEDADLGLRLTQYGYLCGVLNSTTFEEANVSIPNWIRQRSRWIKGYMQTFLVHMRHPVKLYRSLGPVGFWGFQFFVGGGVFTQLVNPLLWAVYVLWLAGLVAGLERIFMGPMLYLTLFNLLLGNFAMIYFSIMCTLKRSYYRLIPYTPTVVVYWLLMSVAAYKALWQLIHKPFYWEKTLHGISKHTA